MATHQSMEWLWLAAVAEVHSTVLAAVTLLVPQSQLELHQPLLILVHLRQETPLLVTQQEKTLQEFHRAVDREVLQLLET